MELENNSRIRLANLFLILILVFGLLMIFLEPPYVTSDEHAHLLNIWRISHGSFFANSEEGRVGSYITVEEREYLRDYFGLWNNPQNGTRYSVGTMMELWERPVSEEMLLLEYSSDSLLNPLSYAIPGIFIFILRILGFGINAFNGMMIAKMVNLLFYALVARWAILKTGVFPKTMFMLALMPMSIYQAASVSYDALIIPCSFLLFAYITKILLSADDYRIRMEDIIAICFASVFLIGCKVAYAPFLLVLFAIPIKKFGNLKKYFICIGCVVGIFLLAYYVPSQINAHIGSVLSGGAGSGKVSAQAQFMKDNFWHFPKVIVSTIAYFGSAWLGQFFGIFGYMDTKFPPVFIGLYFVFLTYVALTEAMSIEGIRWNARLLSFAGFATFFIGTIYVMYVKWTPNLYGIVGGDLAYGGQGRYFIPVALFVLLIGCAPLLTRVKFLKDKIAPKLLSSCEQVTPLASFGYLGFTILFMIVRYWA